MNLSTSINPNLRKCGEIAATLKVGKKFFTLNCGFCSKVFTKLQAFTFHIGEKHEQELFGCLQDDSCDSDDNENVDKIEKKESEDVLNYQNSLEQFSLNLVCEEIPVLGVIEEFEIETLDNERSCNNDDDEYMNKNNDGLRRNDDLLDNLSDLTHTQNLQIIAIYKSFPCLWDVQHIEFRFNNRRTEAINEMVEEIKTKLNLNLTQNELQRLIYIIHGACRQEKCHKLRCERLNKIYTPICKFYEQISFLNDNISPFKCDFCEETFKGFNIYTIHKSKHDNSKPFTCTLCNRGFMAAANLTVHLRRHTRDYPFECNICKKRFPTTNDVNMHMRGHTGEKPYFCDICGLSLRTWTMFDKHIRRHQKRPSHICTICSKGFYAKNKLTDHMNVHFNKRDKVCNVCGKSFTSLNNLGQHKLIHAEKKKYVCKICKKDFAQYAGLSGHMKSHGTTLNRNSKAIIV